MYSGLQQNWWGAPSLSSQMTKFWFTHFQLELGVHPELQLGFHSDTWGILRMALSLSVVVCRVETTVRQSKKQLAEGLWTAGKNTGI